ncbi:hypothetical protein BC835DRAFT_81285 [Cytidiella melzeri]|nr:hypothetical protein BC835DRAFT_81285 [Cytidiella melzeri]
MCYDHDPVPRLAIYSTLTPHPWPLILLETPVEQPQRYALLSSLFPYNTTKHLLQRTAPDEGLQPASAGQSMSQLQTAQDGQHLFVLGKRRLLFIRNVTAFDQSARNAQRQADKGLASTTTRSRSVAQSCFARKWPSSRNGCANSRPNSLRVRRPQAAPTPSHLSPLPPLLPVAYCLCHQVSPSCRL